MKSILALLLAAVALAAPIKSTAQESALADLPWTLGPSSAAIGSRAEIEVPEGYAFLGAEGTRQFHELLENPATGTEDYVLAPHDLSWFAIFTFAETGYVKDNETLDPEAMLQSVTEGTEQGNIERRNNGWDTLHVLGWSSPPKYDSVTNALEWAILAETGSSKEQVVNFNTRLLGRKGVMEVVVVTGPEELDASIASFKALLPGYEFVGGERYAEFREGDNVAAYGLAALVTGGAAAVASKKGIFSAIGAFLAAAWKFVLGGFIALGIWLKSLFSRKKSDRQNP